MALAAGIREDASSNQAYWDAGYRKSQEYSKGLAAGLFELVDTTGSTGGSVYHDLGNNRDETPAVGRSVYHDLGYAYGLDRVPYDGYAAVLHQGERVLTAREAREADRGGTPIQITITGNTFGAGVTAEEIAQRLADALEVKLAAGRVRA